MKRERFASFGVVLSLLLTSPWATATQAGTHAPGLSLELHAHLFMKQGMSWAFRGDFFGPLRAESWRDRFSSQANSDSVQHSGIGVLVVSLYAHPWMTWNLRDSIREQIELTRKFVEENADRWVLARSSGEAREALARGKRVLVLSLEGASGILESEQDLKEFVDERGIRIVGPLHLTDDEFGGVAFLRGLAAWSSPWAYLRNLITPHRDAEGVRTNDEGLSWRGRKLVARLLARGVWLDLAHASDAVQAELIQRLRQAGAPLLYTHTTLREYLRAERAISASQLRAVRDTGGIIGLVPSPDMLLNTPTEPASCAGGIEALARQYREIASVIGAESIGFGSDTNGAIPHLSDACAPADAGLSQGLWNIGLSGETWAALQKAGAPVPTPLSASIDRFLEAWSRAEKLAERFPNR